MNRDAFMEAERAKTAARLVALEQMGAKVNEVRKSIVGMQGLNFSEHVYPLVAALNEAGFDGGTYEANRKSLGTLIEQTKAAETELAAERLKTVAAQAEAVGLRETLKKVDNIACRSVGPNVPEDVPEPANRDGEELHHLAHEALAAPSDDSALREFGLRVAVECIKDRAPLLGQEAIGEVAREKVDAVLRGETAPRPDDLSRQVADALERSKPLVNEALKLGRSISGFPAPGDENLLVGGGALPGTKACATCGGSRLVPTAGAMGDWSCPDCAKEAP